MRLGMIAELRILFPEHVTYSAFGACCLWVEFARIPFSVGSLGSGIRPPDSLTPLLLDCMTLVSPLPPCTLVTSFLKQLQL